MNKNNTKSVKSVTKNGKTVKAKKVAAKVEVIAPVVEVAPAPLMNIPVVASVKRGRGRPKSSLSQSLVSLADLSVLPPNSNIVLPNPFIRSLARLGINLKATPFKAGATSLSEIENIYKKSLPASQIVAVDLNKEVV